MGLAVEEATEAVEAETVDRFSMLFSSPMHIFGKKIDKFPWTHNSPCQSRCCDGCCVRGRLLKDHCKGDLQLWSLISKHNNMHVIVNILTVMHQFSSHCTLVLIIRMIKTSRATFSANVRLFLVSTMYCYQIDLDFLIGIDLVHGAEGSFFEVFNFLWVLVWVFDI